MTDLDISTLKGMEDVPAGKFTFPMQADYPPETNDPTRIKDSHRFARTSLKLLMYAVMTGKAVQLVGPTGSGKTSEVIQFFERINQSYIVVSCHNDMEAQDLFGYERVRPADNGHVDTVFIYGPVLWAMKNGVAVILEERDSLPPTVNLALNNVLDGLGYRIPETNEHVPAEPGFFMIATANTAGAGDETGRYTTSNISSASSNNRWLTVECDYMPTDHEVEVLRAYAHDNSFDEALGALVQFAGSTRSAVASGEMETAATTRELVQAVELASMIPSLDDCMAVAYFNKLSSSDRESATKLWSMLFGVADDTEEGT